MLIASFEGHLGYDVKPFVWVSLDGNFWYGGRTSFNGVENPETLQKNSRIGVTASVRVGKHQSLKFSYSGGAFVTFGATSEMFQWPGSIPGLGDQLVPRATSRCRGRVRSSHNVWADVEGRTNALLLSPH